MSVIYSDTLKTNRLQLMSDLVAGKTFTASTGSATAGNLVIGTSALSGGTGILAQIALPTTPFVVSGSGTVIATLQGVPLSDTSADATGTAAKAEIRNNSGTVIVSGLTVGTSGTDIILTSTSITATQTVTVTSGVITHG
jgi:hypothetical protein